MLEKYYLPNKIRLISENIYKQQPIYPQNTKNPLSLLNVTFVIFEFAVPIILQN
jgi:hypothetical protein